MLSQLPYIVSSIPLVASSWPVSWTPAVLHCARKCKGKKSLHKPAQKLPLAFADGTRQLQAEGASRDVLLLDIALDNYLRICVERIDKSTLLGDDLVNLTALVLRNAVIANDSRDLQQASSGLRDLSFVENGPDVCLVRNVVVTTSSSPQNIQRLFGTFYIPNCRQSKIVLC